MKVNRIYVVIALLVLALTYYEARLKPQSRPLYERGLALYRAGDYSASLLALERAYEIEPNSTAILVLKGWDHLKLRQYADARANFGRAARLNPELVEAQLGLAYVALETGTGETSMAGVRALLQQDPDNRDFQLAAAAGLRQAGKNMESQTLFARLRQDSRYGHLAEINLRDMYGLEGVNEPIPSGLPKIERPSQLRLDFRTNNPYLQQRVKNAWENFYVKGVNLGPATPGSFTSEAPNRVDAYAEWLRQIVLGANVVRVYTVLPPAFYRAFKQHNETPGLPRLYLLQGAWLVGPDETDLFAAPIKEAAQQEIAKVIDLIHGQGDLPLRKGRASGLYAVDVSNSVLGILVGRELEPHLVQANNEQNSFRKSYAGKYVSLENGTPTEAWLAEMLDYAAAYETEKYNEQHPLSVANWPPLDPLNHPTEATLQQQIAFQRRAGEKPGELPSNYDDNDAASIDETRFLQQPALAGGLFVSYSVHPFYPEFFLHEPALLAARDKAGPNPFLGYLKMLKGYYRRMPVLVTEYGASTSIGISHLQPNGWNQGGFNEAQQGEYLARMTQNIAEAGCAGGLAIEWQDEWFKTNWLTSPFQTPFDRRALWLDALNPQANYGIWGYVPSQARLFSSDASAWNAIKPLYQKASARPTMALDDGADEQRVLQKLAVSSDEEFLYLRLSVRSLPRAADGTPPLKLANYIIGISTRPGRFGSRTVPGFAPRVQSADGFNFLIHVSGGGAQLLVASNYSPFSLLKAEGSTDRTFVGLRRNWNPGLDNWAPFEPIVVEPNAQTFGRDGTAFPSRRQDRSVLRYGPLDANSARYDSLATWSADFQNNALVFRVPWGLLFVTDPSSLQVYEGSDGTGHARAAATDGFAFFAMSFRPGNRPPDWSEAASVPLAVADFLPTPDSRLVFPRLERYRWSEWNAVKVNGRLKAGAQALQNSFREVKPR